MTSTAVRRLLALAASTGLVLATILATAAPASADTPEGWPKEESVDMLHALLVLGGVPALIFLVIFALGYGPALARGESVRPGGEPLPESQWLGGPRKSGDELAAPDSEDSKAGGAGGTW